jgi:putative RNA 2'-phosphotransferase
MSGALRHFPGDAGLSLDDRGWTEYETLVDAVTGKYPWATPEHVEAVIATDSKGRFERRGEQVRAAYGHSVDVKLESTETKLPNRLYHGTAPRNLDAIAEEGLKSMGRQQVHLSKTPAEARDVGERHTDEPVLLVIDARSMEQVGFEIDERGVETYTVDYVPPEYIAQVDETTVRDTETRRRDESASRDH